MNVSPPVHKLTTEISKKEPKPDDRAIFWTDDDHTSRNYLHMKKKMIVTRLKQ